jgi:hypothetical protein
MRSTDIRFWGKADIAQTSENVRLLVCKMLVESNSFAAMTVREASSNAKLLRNLENGRFVGEAAKCRLPH